MSTDEPGLRCYGCEHCTHDDRRDDGICLGHCDACQAELAELPIYSRED